MEKCDKGLHFLQISVAVKFIAGLIIQYVSVNIKGKKSIFTGTRTYTRLIFVFVASVLVMSSPKQTTAV
jgi:ethanolamine transporter EutH